MKIQLLVCLGAVLLFTNCHKDKNKPVEVSVEPSGTNPRKIAVEREKNVGTTGFVTSLSDTRYFYNTAGQPTLMVQTDSSFTDKPREISKTTFTLNYTSGKLNKIDLNMDGDPATMVFHYDNENRLIRELFIEQGFSTDTTLYAYTGNQIVRTKKFDDDRQMDFFSPNLDSTLFISSSGTSASYFKYNSTIDLSHQALRKYLPLFFSQNELIEVTRGNYHATIARTYDEQYYPLTALEIRTGSTAAKKTEFWYQ